MRLEFGIMVLFYSLGVIIMSDTTNLSIRIDRGLKDEADQIFNEMGMNLTTAITIFVRQAVRQKRIPFEIALDTTYGRNVSLAEARAAAERIWENAERNGTANMSMEEIDAEIKAARAERKARGVNV
jgi:DNA-damage-inducible protein J